MSSLTPGATLGMFTIERALSADGVTTRVFLAHETSSADRKAAIKLVHAEGRQRTTLEGLVQRETDILCAVRHPGIVRIYPLVTDDSGRESVTYAARAVMLPGQPWYYAMEYIPGASLASLAPHIADQFPLGWRVELFYQILTIVDHMHQSGYAHGDLKPHNILFRRPLDPHEIPAPVLIGFGSATPIEEISALRAASLAYSPPEVLLAIQGGIPIENIPLYPDKTDIWVLGAILFEILTGRALAAGRTRADLIDAMLNDELDTLAEVRPDMPASLDTLLRVLLRATPEARPPVIQVIRAVEERISGLRPPRIAVADPDRGPGASQ
jgi:serine/threonine-protein kinase